MAGQAVQIRLGGEQDGGGQMVGDLVAAVERGDPQQYSGPGVQRGVQERRVPVAGGQPLDQLGDCRGVGGTIASTRGASAEEIGRTDVTVAPIMAAASADKLALLLDQVAAGTLRVNIETAIPLEHAPEAFASFAAGTLGKVLITR